MRLAFLGGIYNNYLALDSAIRDAKQRGVDAIYCLGDMGAFGPDAKFLSTIPDIVLCFSLLSCSK